MRFSAHDSRASKQSSHYQRFDFFLASFGITFTRNGYLTSPFFSSLQKGLFTPINIVDYICIYRLSSPLTSPCPLQLLYCIYIYSIDCYVTESRA